MKNVKEIQLDTYIKKMDINEFVEKGYLQELNRQFLHPLGLALEIETDHKTNTTRISGIWDCRSEQDGIIFDYQNASSDRIERAKFKKDYVENEMKNRLKVRKELLGFEIEPIV